MVINSNDWPMTRGNVWMLEKRTGVLRYMSDQYRGTVLGFEERNGVTHAQTPPVAVGMVMLGGGVSIERPAPESFDWHVVNEKFQSGKPVQKAQSHAIISQCYARHCGQALKSIIALSEPLPGITELEALVGGALYSRILARVKAAKAMTSAWEKDFVIDRIGLSLLAGESTLSEVTADQHYADIAQSLRTDLTVASGQTSLPLVVVSQSAGLQRDGTSEVILAEGRLDIEHPTLGFIVATPKYPFPMIPEMPGTHTPEASALIDELECIAINSVQSGQPWHCPSMELAALSKRKLYIKFSTLSDLVLGDGPHGFSVEGCDNGATITNVKTDGDKVVLTFNKAPTGDLHILYAWGSKSDKANGMAANQGALRDSWSTGSLVYPETQLFRYALSGRVKVLTEQTGQLLVPPEK